MMFSSRNCTNFYVLYLLPNKNQLTISKFKQCSKSDLVNFKNLRREFRTKAQAASSTTQTTPFIFNNLNEDKSSKKNKFFDYFSQNKELDKFKNILNHSKLTDDEKGQIKVDI